MTALLEAGHTLDLRVNLDKRHAHMGAGIAVDQIAARYPAFSFGVNPPRADPWLKISTRWRLALDYLRYSEPEFANAVALRERARGRAPVAVRFLAERTPLGGLTARALQALEAAVPIDPDLQQLVREHVARRRHRRPARGPRVGPGRPGAGGAEPRSAGRARGGELGQPHEQGAPARGPRSHRGVEPRAGRGGGRAPRPAARARRGGRRACVRPLVLVAGQHGRRRVRAQGRPAHRAAAAALRLLVALHRPARGRVRARMAAASAEPAGIPRSLPPASSSVRTRSTRRSGSRTGTSTTTPRSCGRGAASHRSATRRRPTTTTRCTTAAP